MVSSYIPKRGDIIFVNFSPQAGKEQAGRRPAVVLSPLEYNQKVGLALCCPITNQVKGYPFEVALPKKSAVTGVILCDHIKSIDWKERGASFAMTLPQPILQDVLAKIGVLLE